MNLKDKFDECFKAEFPATFEAAQKGEPEPHGNFSIAWWGFSEGYRCALPTSEPVAQRKRFGDLGWVTMIFIWAVFGFLAGYKYPRDIELESAKPVEIRYEVTPEAARYLVLKAVKGIEPE